MQQFTLNSPLHRAEVAIRQRDWSLVRQLLQPLIAKSDTPEHATTYQSELQQGLTYLLDQIFLVLDEGDFRDRWDVAKLLASSGDWAIAPLIERLRDEETDPDVRWFAARILGDMQNPAAIAPLVATIRQSDLDELRDVAAIALTSFEDQAIAPLTELLHDSATRGLAVRALAQIHQPEVVSVLLSVVNDTDPLVRQTAIEALSQFSEPQLLPVLLQALKDLSAPVRKVAVTGLGLRRDGVDPMDLVHAITPLLYDFNLDVCGQAAIALGRVGTPAAVEALVTTLRSPHTPEPLQLDIIRALGWVSTPQAIDALLALLPMSSEPFVGDAVYQAVIRALAAVTVEPERSRIAHQLVMVLQSPHWISHSMPLKQALIVGLGQLGQASSLDPLMHCLQDADLSLRLHTVFALKQLPAVDAYSYLERCLAQPNLPPELRQGITFALSEWGQS